MKILAIESSSLAASCAICEGENVLASSKLCVGLLHSRTLMVLVDNMFRNANIDVKDIGIVAVSCGPGSFTGLRIGVAAAKGIALGLGVPCVGVDSLLGLAYNLIDLNSVIVCAVLDARRNTVYTALFNIENFKVIRCCEDGVLEKEELKQKLILNKQPTFLVGDAASSCYEYMQGVNNIFLASPQLRLQSAVSVALCAQQIIKNKTPLNDIVVPKYIQLSQAERERAEKLKDIF